MGRNKRLSEREEYGMLSGYIKIILTNTGESSTAISNLSFIFIYYNFLKIYEINRSIYITTKREYEL